MPARSSRERCDALDLHESAGFEQPRDLHQAHRRIIVAHAGAPSIADRGTRRTVGVEIGHERQQLDDVLRAAARQLGARLSFEETSRLLALCGFQPHPTVAPRTGATLQLANNLRAERSPRELRLSRHQS